VSDVDGSRSNTWFHDARGRLVGVVDADEQRQSMGYDSFGNLVMITERGGQVTVHEYDARGRRTRTVTPTGADLTFGYDDLDRVTTVVTEAGAVTEYTYRGTGPGPCCCGTPRAG
jgi:YD repeat-containing protein